MNNNAGSVSELGQRNKIKLLVVMFTSLVLMLISVLGLTYVRRSVEETRKFELDRLASELVTQAEVKMDMIVNSLYGLRMVVMSDNVDSREWSNALLALEMEKRFGGLHSVGYSERVANSVVGIYETGVKEREGGGQLYGDFFVYPKSSNQYYYPTRYLYASDKEVSILLGFDIGFVKEIQTTIEKAINSGDPMISESVNLSAVIPSSNKNGYLILLPTFSTRTTDELSPTERLRYHDGIVWAWMNFSSIFKDLHIDDIHLQIIDGDNVIFSSTRNDFFENDLAVKKRMKLLGKEFVVKFVVVEGLIKRELRDSLPILTASAVIFFNLLWYVTAYLFLSTGAKAHNLAKEATLNLTKFKLAVDSVSDHVMITNVGGVVIYANKAAEKMTGYTVEEMIGRTPSLWGKQMSKEYYENFWKTIKMDKKTFVGQLTNKKKGGQTYDVELTVSPIFDENGELRYFLGIERDVTKQKAIEKMKTEFISLASHQLRTPLSAVKWFGKMLADGEAGPLSDMQRQYLEKINQSNEREIKLVNSLLNVSRIESGRIFVDPKPTDMKKLAEEVLSEVRLGNGGSEREFDLNLEDNVPLMNVDADLIRHVYMNLLSNAVRYTSKGGRIELRQSVRAGELVCEVVDDGIGIPDNEQARLFEKFFRASNAVKKETDGNGLGLFLARAVIESSGGTIGFESKEGSGSTFWFTLPLEGVLKKEGELSMV